MMAVMETTKPEVKVCLISDFYHKSKTRVKPHILRPFLEDEVFAHGDKLSDGNS